MLKTLLAVTITLLSISVYAMNLLLPKMDVASVAEQIRAKMPEGKLEFNIAQELKSEDIHDLVIAFYNNMPEKMNCVVETSKEPMAFSCQHKEEKATFEFQTTGVVHLDNSQIIGVELDDSFVTVLVRKSN